MGQCVVGEDLGCGWRWQKWDKNDLFLERLDGLEFSQVCGALGLELLPQLLDLEVGRGGRWVGGVACVVCVYRACA